MINIFDEFRKKFVTGDFIKAEKVEDWIKANFIPKSELRKVLAKGYGGGNWRRIIHSLLDEEQKL